MKTIAEARERIGSFLQETGCYSICAQCPVYGEDGCCRGCSHLVRGKGCGQPNTSCLTYTCGTLNMHLSRLPSESHGNKLTEFTALIYGLPREGYRGCERLPGETLLQISDPLEIQAEIDLIGKEDKETDVCER